MYVYTYTTIYSYYYTIRRTNFVLDDRLLWHVILIVSGGTRKIIVGGPKNNQSIFKLNFLVLLFSYVTILVPTIYIFTLKIVIFGH
jgi:hypothetical protein